MTAQRLAILTGLTLALAAASYMPAVAQQPPPRQTMIFFHAKGGPDACGPGCSEWIAAEGAFTTGTHGELSAFLHALDRSDLPVFFHSPGGSSGAGIAVGHMLRGWRIAAGVGRTVVPDCKEAQPRDAHCLALLRSGGPVTAELRFDRARCASACVTALIGAPIRQVAAQASLGIHSANYGYNRQWGIDNSADDRAALARWRDVLRDYLVTMGVDGGLLEEMEKTPHDKIHWMSREEMRRFGIVNDGAFETGWTLAENLSFTVMKSLTRTTPRTTVLKFRCHIRDLAQIVVRRELPDDEREAQFTARLVSGRDVIVQFRGVIDQRDDERTMTVPVATLRGIAANGLVLEESVTTETGETVRSLPVATAGFAEALDRMLPQCGVPRPPPTPPTPPKPKRLRFAGEAATLPPL